MMSGLLKNRLATVFLLVSLLFGYDFLFAQSTQLLDDFNRTSSTTVGGGWTEVESASPGGAQIITNSVLQLGSTTQGRDYIWQDVSSRYNTVFNSNTGLLTWQFNFRQTRSDPSGFDGGSYGIAYILGATSSNFLTANGYAIVLGNSGNPDNVRLVRFTNGLSLNTNLSTIIGPTVYNSTAYLTVQVQYNPVGNNWSLFVDSSTTAFIDPLSATFVQIGSTTTDATYTGNDLLFTGCFWNHSTRATEFGTFDNIRIPSACILNTEPTVPSSGLTATAIGANSMQLNWTRGNGSQCIIIGHKAGAVVTTPVDGATYTANTTFGLGTLMAANEYVVYMGSGNSAVISGLASLTSYEFRIFEFNGVGCTSNFLLSSPATLAVSTIGCVLAAEPTIGASGLTMTVLSSNSEQLNWTRGNGSYCIVVFRAGGPVIMPPADGNSYTANSIYGLGSTTGTGDFIIYSGTGTQVTVSGLMPGSTYYASVFEMNGTGCNTNYLIPGSWPVATGITTTVAAYNYYFGNIHSHSDYSDGDIDNACPGTGSANCCYSIGDGALNFDFMGIADHNHNEGPVMTLAKYASGWSEAATYTNANFAALYGMEWGTISTGGHATVYGINKLLGWNTGNYDVFIAKGDYNSLFTYIANTPNAFATLCHPNDNDYGNLKSIAYNATYDNAIVGCAVRNGPFNSTNTTYTDPSSGNFLSYWQRLLSLGYHLGPTMDQDNHNSATMGKCSQARTVIQATSLTPASVMDAFINMRFYASDDYNLRVDMKVNNAFPMGSIVAQNINPSFLISATDPDGEAITNIKLYFGEPGSGLLPTMLTSVNASSLSFTHSMAVGTFYYYAEITQADGQMAWTSPVWYTKTTTPLPIELLDFSGEPSAKGNLLKWTTASEINNAYFTIERSQNGHLFESIGTKEGSGTTSMNTDYKFVDQAPMNGINYYRLKQTDFDGSFTYTHTIAVTKGKQKELFTLLPNPSSGKFNIIFPERPEYRYDIRIIDPVGQIVFDRFNLNEQIFTVDPEINSSGVYSIVVFMDGQYTVKKMIIEKSALK